MRFLVDAQLPPALPGRLKSSDEMSTVKGLQED
jgi:predicted nuclease of predicted toxin-antitoxin system